MVHCAQPIWCHFSTLDRRQYEASCKHCIAVPFICFCAVRLMSKNVHLKANDQGEYLVLFAFLYKMGIGLVSPSTH